MSLNFWEFFYSVPHGLPACPLDHPPRLWSWGEFFHKIVEKFLTVHALHGAAVMEKKGCLEYTVKKIPEI